MRRVGVPQLKHVEIAPERSAGVCRRLPPRIPHRWDKFLSRNDSVRSTRAKELVLRSVTLQLLHSARLGRAVSSAQFEPRGLRSQGFCIRTSSEKVFPVARPAASFRALRLYSSAFAPSDRAAHVGRRGGDVGARPQRGRDSSSPRVRTWHWAVRAIAHGTCRGLGRPRIRLPRSSCT